MLESLMLNVIITSILFISVGEPRDVLGDIGSLWRTESSQENETHQTFY